VSDWWANKLGTQQPQAPRTYGITVPTQPAQQPQPVQPQPQQVVVPAQPVPQQEARRPDGRQAMLDPNRPKDAEIGMGEALRLWEGGQAQRAEGHLACPACGSKTGYTEYSATMMHGSRPRPHCFECGHNGVFTQGLESSWA
jgi:hypothetical protein